MWIGTDHIDAVIFDMDGILFDTERLCKDAWKASAVEIGLVDGPEDMRKLDTAIRHCIGLNHTDTRAYLYSMYGKDLPYDRLHDLCSRRMREKIDADGLPVKKGVREILAYLKETDLRIGLASSSRRASVLSHLERAGLTSYFQSITGGDIVEHSKPNPDIYLIACKQLSVAPTNAIAIEDSPNGLKSAYAAGMHPVMVPDMIEPTPEVEALLDGRKFDSLLDVMDWMKE